MKRKSTTVLLPLVSSFTAASAHHSRVNFDLDTVLEFEGTVVAFDWVNPHTAIYVQTQNDEGETITVEVEGNSIATMVRRGWGPDSLAIGDRVLVRGNPDNNPDRHFVYFNSFERIDTGDLVGGDFGSGTQETISATASTDFTGVWSQVFGGGGGGGGGGGRSILLSSPQPSGLPVTVLGAEAYAAFDADDDPRNDCVPESLPSAISSAPYLFAIEKHADGDFHILHENYANERIIHMGQSAPPAEARPDHDGYSVGRIEDGVLIVETTMFTAEPWGNDTGLPSSDQKTFVERYELLDGGARLQVTYTQTDPVYLSESVTRTLNWEFEPQSGLAAVWTPETCRPSAGRRHIADDE